MVLIQHAFAASQFFITTLTNKEIGDTAFMDLLPIKQSEFGHWIAEPSAIRRLSEHAETRNHLFIEMVAK
jgi:hypothetical protein